MVFFQVGNLLLLPFSIKIACALATSHQIKFDENSFECKVEMSTNGQIYVPLLHPLNISDEK